MKGEQEQLPRDLLLRSLLYPLKSMSLSVMDLCVASSSGMQGTTTTNLKYQELCYRGLPWTSFSMRQRFGHDGAVLHQSGIHPEEPLFKVPFCT